MQIACPRCATSYVLDDALIPPQGAPVQCTRCGHVFTATPPAAAAKPAANATMMFGSNQGPPAGGANSTMMFGAAPAAAPAPAPSGGANSTMMFGAVAPAAPAPAAKPAGGANSTMMFGAAAAPAPAAKPAAGGNSTMMFGALPDLGPAPAPAAKPAAGGNSTMMFGAIPDLGPAPAPAAKPAGGGSSTMMFGALPDLGPAPAPAGKPAGGGSSTMMFGAVPDAPAPAAKPAGGGSSTMMFGAIPDSPAPAPAARPAGGSSTMMFGALPDSPSPQGNGPSPAWQAPPAADGYSPQAPGPTVTQPKPASMLETMPAPMPLPEMLGGSAPQRGLTMEMQAFEHQMQSGGRNKVLAAVAAGLLLVGGGGAYWWSLQPKPPSSEQVAEQQKLFLNLEQDDPTALSSAQAAFKELAGRAPPTWIAPAAGELAALSLQWGDQRDRIDLLTERFEALGREADKLRDGKSNLADWRQRVNGMEEERKKLKDEVDKLSGEVAALDTQQNELLKRLGEAVNKTPDVPADAYRAIGLYYALKGADSFERFASKYRAQVPGDGWADFEAAAAARIAAKDDQSLRNALLLAEKAAKANGRLTRARRLVARLQYQLKDYAAASATVTELQLLHKNDPRLTLLKSSIEGAEAIAKAAANPPPAPPQIPPPEPAPAPQP